jgi:hypothetical protein
VVVMGWDSEEEEEGGKKWCNWMGWSVQPERKTWVAGFSRAKYGQGATVVVGSGRAMVLWAVSSKGEGRGSRRFSGRTKAQTRFVWERVKSAVPSADLGCVISLCSRQRLEDETKKTRTTERS